MRISLFLEKIKNAKSFEVFAVIALLNMATAVFALNLISGEDGFDAPWYLLDFGKIALFIWLWVVGHYSYQEAKISKRIKVVYNFFFFMAMAYILFPEIIYQSVSVSEHALVTHTFLYSMFAFYSLTSYFYTKAKLKTDTKFLDYINSLLLLVFLIIGVWYIQPVINKFQVRA
ncbi:hypothetical protein EOPP23_19190 [Endozoicomonas sp. OPT23]|uniref:hypothetical protein n=1 Tax=Endozoicomonas sp. OPT23 TaxID=2072845 RepID=UPI00129B0D3F|nr:hypothetical protein [Endozoicomonas sp. OPT23]MRI35094.1 hypothetical protein [Endozoicomonas sp. OPT23]